MIVSFADQGTRDIYDGRNTKRARRVPADLHATARRKLDRLHAAATLEDLRFPPGNNLEALKGRQDGLHSLRVNDQWRIVFRWEPGQAHDVQIVDYH